MNILKLTYIALVIGAMALTIWCGWKGLIKIKEQEMDRRLEKTTSILSLVMSLIILATGINLWVTSGEEGYFAGVFITICGVICIIVSNFLIWQVFHRR
jgi:hypothetical protein